MMNSSVIRNSSFHSVLGESSVLAPRSEKQKRNIVADLLLTALIDAFSILVIFLLMNFSSSGEILLLSSEMELPKADSGVVLERHPVVKIDGGKIYLEENEVAEGQLVGALLRLRARWNEVHAGGEFPGILTIQGDRRLKYEMLNSIVLASSEAGFSDIKFAVIMK